MGKLMHAHLINHSALGYLNQWHKTDQPFMLALQKESDAQILAPHLKKLAIKYQVIRNFPTAHINDSARVNRLWIRAAEALCAVDIEKTGNPSTEVHGLADQLGSIFPFEDKSSKSTASLLSAASKFLWFKGHTSVRIYDKRAVDALNRMQKKRVNGSRSVGWRVDGDYEVFANAWKAEYQEYASKIAGAVQALEGQVD
jgi:hypothetical protein